MFFLTQFFPTGVPWCFELKRGFIQLIEYGGWLWGLRLGFDSRNAHSCMRHRNIGTDPMVHLASYSAGTGVKVPQPEADHSSPSRSDVKISGLKVAVEWRVLVPIRRFRIRISSLTPVAMIEIICVFFIPSRVMPECLKVGHDYFPRRFKLIIR
jgi:hypothetical protein